MSSVASHARPWPHVVEAITRSLDTVTGTEDISLHGANGRILARPLATVLPLPGETHAVMDGFALGALPPGSYRLVHAGIDRIGIGEAAPVLAQARQAFVSINEQCREILEG